MARSALKMILRELNIIKKNNFLNFYIYNIPIQCFFIVLAGWQSGYAAACKAVYAGSIPASASMKKSWDETGVGQIMVESI